MLNIYFGDMPSAIYNTEIYFKNTLMKTVGFSMALQKKLSKKWMVQT